MLIFVFRRVGVIHTGLKKRRKVNMDRREYPRVETCNLISYVSIDENDRIWIEHYEPFFKDKPRTETTYDIFSSDGKFLFTTQINQNVYPQLIFKNGYIYTLARSESGYAIALRMRMIEN